MSGFKYLTAKILKIAGFATALLMVVTIFVFMPSATSKANADPINAPTTITLTRTYNADGTVTLEATMDKALELSSSTAYLYIVGNTAAVDSRTTGSVIDFTVNRPSSGVQQYNIKVNSITSNMVSVQALSDTWSVSMAPSASQFSTDDPTPTLNWTTNQALSSQSYYGIYFVDVTTGTIINRSNTVGSSGSQGIIKFYNGGAHEYSVYIAKYDASIAVVANLLDVQDISSSVFISRAPWTVNLSIDRNIFSTDDSTPVITWTTNQTIGNTRLSTFYNSAYAVYFVNSDTGAILSVNSNATSLSVSQGIPRFFNGPTVNYKMYVAKYDTSGITNSSQLTDIQAISNIVSVSRATWTINLSVDNSTFYSNDPTPQYTWTTNQTIGNTRSSTLYNSAYAVYFVDNTTGAIISVNSNATTLSVTQGIPRFYTGGTKTYIAYVAKYDTSGITNVSQLTDIQATSNTFNVTRGAWNVTLSVDHNVFSTSDPTPQYTWTTNQPIGDTSSGMVGAAVYAVYFVDNATGAVISSNNTTNNDSLTGGIPRFYKGGPQTYKVYVAERGETNVSQFTDIQASSNTITVTRAVWTVGLSIDRTSFSTDDPSPVVTWTTNQTILGSGTCTGCAAYSVYLVNHDTGAVVGSNYTSSALTSTLGVPRFYSGPPQTFLLYVAESGKTNVSQFTDIQATSSMITVSRSPWSLTLQSTVSYPFDGDSNPANDTKTVAYTWTTNQSVNKGSACGVCSVAYAVYIVDVTSGAIVATNTTSGTTGTGSISLPKTASDYYLAYVAKNGGYTTYSQLTDIQAVSGILYPDAASGPVNAKETSGGGNPSEANCQQCAGDPINTTTGEFFASDTDLTLNSPIPFSLNRSYSSTKTTSNGDFGYGWTSNYAQRIVDSDSLTSTTTLPTAKQLTITQENGSTVVFNQLADGTYLAPNRVFASLVYDSASNLFTLTRTNGYRFIFDATTGLIMSIKDRNDNSLTTSYDTNNHLTQILSSNGQSITLTWTGSVISSAADSTGKTVTYNYTSGNLTDITLPNGGVQHYGYSSGRLILTATQINGGVTTNVYDTSNRVIKQTDPMGNITTFSYSVTSSGIITTITNPDGSITRDEYNTNYQLVKETLAYGTANAQVITHTYGSNSQITGTTNPDGSTTSYAYDSNGNVISTTDELGRTTTGTYNSFNEPLTTTDPAGRLTTYTYDSHGNPATVTNARGDTTTFTVNNIGLQTQVRSPLGANVNYAYNSSDVLTSVTNSLNQTTTFTVNNSGLPTTVTDPAGNAMTKTYDVNGNVLTSTDPAGNVTTYTYDTSNELLTSTDPAGNVTVNIHDLNGNITAQRDATYHSLNYSYNNMNRVSSFRDKQRNITRYTYDLLGRVITSQDALNNTTSYTYNWRGQVLTTTLPSGKIYTKTYDAAGQLLTSKDPSNNTTTYTYDLSGEVLTVTDAMNRVTSFTYDALGRVLTVIRPDHTTETVTYDADGRKTSYTDGLGHTATYVYDAAGKLTSSNEYGVVNNYDYNNVGDVVKKTNAADSSYSTYVYNNRNLVTGINYSDGTPAITYDYNNRGQRSSMVDSNGTTTYSYDALGRETSVVNTIDGTIGYTYDANSNLTALSYPHGNNVTYAYNANNQMASVTEPNVGQIKYSYNNDGLLNSTSYPNGITTSNTRDANNRLSSIESKNVNNASVLKFNYTYDATGLITLQTTTDPTTTVSKGYTYNSLSQMNTVSTGGTTDGSYSFDAISNVTASPSGDAFSYNSQNQLISKNNTANNSTASYSYDVRGNRVGSNTVTSATSNTNNFGYNVANQLITANLGSNPPNATNITYSYNGDGLRDQKTKTISGVTTTDKYIWDSNNALPTLLEDTNTVYIYGINSTPIAQVNKNNNNVIYLHTDQLGSVRATSDTSGNITGEVTYDEYGNRTATSGTVNTSFGFAGEYKDSDTGFYYLRARWYDPATAQFISVDPKLSTTHLAYGYTAGNPLLYTDPLGLDFWGDVGQAALGGLDGLTGGASTMILDTVAPGVINHCSSAFNIASAVATVASFLIPGEAALHAVAFAAHAFVAFKATKVLMGAVAGAGKLTKIDKTITASEKMVPIYRVVGDRELASIKTAQKFEIKGNALEGGKYFFNTRTDLLKYITKLPGSIRKEGINIVSAEIPHVVWDSHESLLSGIESSGKFISESALDSIKNIRF